jgi:hypothetical protein
MRRRKITAAPTANIGGTHSKERRRPQQSKPPGGVEEMGEDRLCAIPQLGTGGAAVFAGVIPFNAAPPSTSDPASGKKKCCNCNVDDLFNYDFKKCRDCLKKLICTKCYSSAQEYHLKYSFKYILEYCQTEYTR